MDRLIRIVGVGLTLALVGYAAILLFGNPDVDGVMEDVIADGERGEAQPEMSPETRERMRMVGRGLAMSPDGDALGPEALASEAPISSVPYGSGEIDITSARDGFDYAMGKVGTVGDSRRRVTVEEWDELYREANDAFAALSIVLDAKNEAELAELEEAHVRLKKGLKRVRVRGRKFAQ